MPTGHHDDSWNSYYLNTLKKVKAIKLPMTNEVIERLNDIANRIVWKIEMPKFRFIWNEEDGKAEYDSDVEIIIEYDSDVEVVERDNYNWNYDSRDNKRYIPRVSDNIDSGVDHDDIEEDNINENYLDKRVMSIIKEVWEVLLVVEAYGEEYWWMI